MIANTDGQVCCRLAHPWRDGTQALLFTPVELLEKLASLIPRPHVNLLVYHGVLAPHARARSQATALVVPRDPSPFTPSDAAGSGAAAPIPAAPTTAGPHATTTCRAAQRSCVDRDDPPAAERARARRGWLWADQLRRVFQIDVLACTACGGRLRFIASIEDPPVVQTILTHLGLPTGLPEPHPARPPPGADDTPAFDFPD